MTYTTITYTHILHNMITVVSGRPIGFFSYRPIPIKADISRFSYRPIPINYRYHFFYIGRYRCRYRYRICSNISFKNAVKIFLRTENWMRTLNLVKIVTFCSISLRNFEKIYNFFVQIWLFNHGSTYFMISARLPIWAFLSADTDNRYR